MKDNGTKPSIVVTSMQHRLKKRNLILMIKSVFLQESSKTRHEIGYALTLTASQSTTILSNFSTEEISSQS